MRHLIFYLTIISCLIHIGCKEKIETTSPMVSDIVESVYASGIIKSDNEYEVFSKINGTVKKIFVKEGDAIKKGSPLFLIENVNSKVSAENARLLASANDYAENQGKLSEAKITLDLAQKKLSNDSLLFIRQQELWRQSIGSKIDLEQRELGYENAKVNLKKAKVAYEDIKRQLKLSSDQSKNNLRIAQASANDLIIRSDVDGNVYKVNASIGELTTAARPLAVVGEKNFIIELSVDEYDIVKMKEGQKTIVRMDSYRDQAFEAKINFIYPMMNERTRTFKVEAIFTKRPEVLYPNLSLEANIVINEKKDVLTIPTNYLMNDSSVMMPDGSIKKIKLGLSDFTITEVVSGIDKASTIRLPKK